MPIKIDLTGQRFERLKVIERAGSKGRDALWRCKCKCGKEALVATAHLRSGKTISCGCHRLARGRAILEEGREVRKELFCVRDTILQSVTQRKLSTNTSGVTGVSWDRARDKWAAVIIFQKKKYHLGRYTEKDDAIAARKAAEERLHGPFLEWFYSDEHQAEIAAQKARRKAEAAKRKEAE